MRVLLALLLCCPLALAAQDIDLNELLDSCPDCAGTPGEPVCIMIVEGSGVQVPNPCYAACLGYPTVGPWFCEDLDGGGGEADNGPGDGEGDGDGSGGGDNGGDDGDGGGDPAEGDGDGDGVGDDDGDGLTDIEEGELGTDPEDPDSDDDGLNDGAEGDAGTDTRDADSDDDGLTDGAEVNLFDTDPNNPDSDGNGIGDAQQILNMAQSNCSADLNGDMMVNVQDVLQMLGQFGDTCN